MIFKNCDANSFIKFLDGKKVICFGAGRQMEKVNFQEKIPYLEEHICFFVDNDIKKQGTNFNYKNKKFPIKSPFELEIIDFEKYVILITSIHLFSMINQLDMIDNLVNIECYIYLLILFNPTVDLHNFFTVEYKKPAYSNYADTLKSYNFKDKHKGERCFIIGNGPSLNPSDLDKIKNETSFASNRIYKLFDKTDWKPNYYFASDANLILHDSKQINNMESDFIFTALETALYQGFINDNFIYLNYNQKSLSNNNCNLSDIFFSYDITDCVDCYNTITYIMLQIAVYMGFDKIYLLGIDNSYAIEKKIDGTIIKNENISDHFSKDYDEIYDKNNQIIRNVDFTTLTYKKAREAAEAVGVKIYNATRGGKLEVFERVDFDSLF